MYKFDLVIKSVSPHSDLSLPFEMKALNWSKCLFFKCSLRWTENVISRYCLHLLIIKSVKIEYMMCEKVLIQPFQHFFYINGILEFMQFCHPTYIRRFFLNNFFYILRKLIDTWKSNRTIHWRLSGNIKPLFMWSLLIYMTVPRKYLEVLQKPQGWWLAMIV